MEARRARGRCSRIDLGSTDYVVTCDGVDLKAHRAGRRDKPGAGNGPSPAAPKARTAAGDSGSATAKPSLMSPVGGKTRRGAPPPASSSATTASPSNEPRTFTACTRRNSRSRCTTLAGASSERRSRGRARKPTRHSSKWQPREPRATARGAFGKAFTTTRCRSEPTSTRTAGAAGRETSFRRSRSSGAAAPSWRSGSGATRGATTGAAWPPSRRKHPSVKNRRTRGLAAVRRLLDPTLWKRPARAV